MVVAGEIDNISDINEKYAMKGNITYVQNRKTIKYRGET